MLVGAEDLLRPWEMNDCSLTTGSHWRVLEKTDLMPLGRRFYEQTRRDPAVLQAALSSATRTANWLLTKTLILSRPRLVDRVLLLFVLWAERWGTVTTDGIRLELPLKHQLISDCCGARRPTTTRALQSLERSGYLTRTGRKHWLLRRTPCTNGACNCLPEYTAMLGPGGPSGDSRGQGLNPPAA